MTILFLCLNGGAFLFCEGVAVTILVRRAPLTFREALPYALGAALTGCINVPFIVLWIGKLHG